MNPKIKKYLKESIKFIIILAIALNVISYFKSQDLNKDDLIYTSYKLLDNSEYNMPKDKPVLVHFWATWCPTCEVEASNIEKISKDYEVITIATQSGSTKEIQNYLKKHNLSFKVVNDEDGFYSRTFNIKAFPTTLIYDENRTLKFSEVGYTSTLGLYARMWWVD
ncbi:redoxin domain-containing protein [Arcobacter roscoffensis]|uniref:Redoxin family protein n=1 Tax=Arcobacter roscoffensis TaxID=2961520 RepID=A0ABY5E167_9BACT|nr:redoxin domain-containing protein [Arcobacter roscoffensis]UTJ05460.1 redoxin family protein [Arcobacter roscoffensis]